MKKNMRKVILLGMAILAMASCSTSDDGFVEAVQAGVENSTAGNPNSDGNGGYNQPTTDFLNSGYCNVKISKYKLNIFRYHTDTILVDVTTMPINILPTSNVVISCGQIKYVNEQVQPGFKKYDANY